MIRKKRWITIFILIVVPLTVYGYFIVQHGLEGFIQKSMELDLKWLALAIFFMFLYWLLESYVLKKVSRILKCKLSFLSAFRITMVGQLFNSLTPFASGGQPMQAFTMVSDTDVGAGLASSILMLKFIVYQLVLTLYSLMVIVFNLRFFKNAISNFVYLAIVGFTVNTAVILVCFLFIKNKSLTLKILEKVFWFLYKIKLIKDFDNALQKTTNELQNFYEVYSVIKHNKRVWISPVVMSTVQLTCFYIIPYLIYRSFRLDNHAMFDMIAAVSFVQMVIAFVPLPGASGAAEGSFYVFFKLFFSESTIALAVLIWRLITYYSCILFGAVAMIFPDVKYFFITLLKRISKKKHS